LWKISFEHRHEIVKKKNIKMAELMGIDDLVETRDVLEKSSNVGDPSASKRGVVGEGHAPP
jgi:hypothetical protein